MPYEVSHIAEDGYLRIVHRGAGDPAEYRSAHLHLAELLAAHKLTKLLVDVREVTNKIPVSSLFWLISSLPDIFPTRCRISIIVNPGVQTDAGFVENVAQNRGLDLRNFHTHEEALEWLLKQKNASPVVKSPTPARESD